MILLKLTMQKIHAMYMENLFPQMRMKQFLIKGFPRVCVTTKSIGAASNPVTDDAFPSVTPKNASHFIDSKWPIHPQSLGNNVSAFSCYPVKDLTLICHAQVANTLRKGL